MAWQLQTTISGLTLPASYWKLSSYQFNHLGGFGNFTLSCFPDVAARQESLLNVIGQPRTYLIKQPMTIAECYLYSKKFLDGTGPMPQEDENGVVSCQPDTRISFFAEAIEI